jgi:hypothetical protein
MERTIPTLSANGWLNNEDTAERVDAAMAYAFTSDNSQSVTFHGHILSIQWIIAQYSGSIINLQTQMRDAMDNYLKKQFDTVDLDISISESGAQLTIEVKGTITNDGVTKGLQYLLTVRNSITERVVNKLNGDVLYAG